MISEVVQNERLENHENIKKTIVFLDKSMKIKQGSPLAVLNVWPENRVAKQYDIRRGSIGETIWESIEVL